MPTKTRPDKEKRSKMTFSFFTLGFVVYFHYLSPPVKPTTGADMMRQLWHLTLLTRRQSTEF
jgi:hypothetical protein